MGRILRWVGVALLALGIAFLALVLTARVHDGPFGPIPGGPLEAGVLVEAPVEDWGFAAGIEEIELEVHPVSPRSLKVWCLVHEGALYVPAAQPERKRWPGQVTAEPRVRVRIEGKLYERLAVPVADPAQADALTAALAEKYGVDTAGGYHGSVAFFRMDPR